MSLMISFTPTQTLVKLIRQEMIVVNSKPIFREWVIKRSQQHWICRVSFTEPWAIWINVIRGNSWRWENVIETGLNKFPIALETASGDFAIIRSGDWGERKKNKKRGKWEEKGRGWGGTGEKLLCNQNDCGKCVCGGGLVWRLVEEVNVLYVSHNARLLRCDMEPSELRREIE